MTKEVYMKKVLSKLSNNHFASVNDALLGQDSTHAQYSEEEKIAASAMTLVGGPLKILHGVSLVLGGIGVAIVPGMELECITREKPIHGAQRSEIDSISPTFSTRMPFARRSVSKVPDNPRLIDIRNESHFGGSFTPGFSNKTQHNAASKPLNARVTVTGAQIAVTGLGVAVEGAVETVGAIPSAAFHTVCKLRQ